MSLIDYAKERDKFELDAKDGGEPRFASEMAWPCCCCKNSGCTDQEEPCRTCGHNINKGVTVDAGGDAP